MKTPTHIYIDDRSKAHALTQKVLEQFPSVPKTIVYDTKAFIKEHNKRENALTNGKKVIFLTVNKGRFLKKCPGTKKYICCGYQILHQASQCSMDCTYCILQSYFNNPLITFFTNLDEMFRELDPNLSKRISETHSFSSVITFSV